MSNSQEQLSRKEKLLTDKNKEAEIEMTEKTTTKPSNLNLKLSGSSQKSTESKSKRKRKKKETKDKNITHAETDETNKNYEQEIPTEKYTEELLRYEYRD